MHLDLDRDRYYCFGCGARGDIVQWVSDIEGVGAVEAVAILEDGRRVNGVFGTGNPGAGGPYSAAPDHERPDLERTSPERVREVMHDAWGYYASAPSHERATEYLGGKRDIDVSALEAELGRFVVGHTPDRPDALTQHLRSEGFTDDEMVDACLALRNRDGAVIDFFRDRVMLPVTDDVDRVIGLIGRTVTDRAPKYLNQSRTHTYDKHLALYRPRRTILDRDANVIVVEGTVDALAIAAQAARSGLSTKFAPITASGLYLSASQLDRVLAIHDRAPVLAGDGDEAGRGANVAWATDAARKGRESVVVTWPEGQDPASWIAARGADGLRALTRKGCLDAPPNDLRPRHCGTVLTQCALDALPNTGDRVAALRQVAAEASNISGYLAPNAGARYATAAAGVLASVVVDVEVDHLAPGERIKRQFRATTQSVGGADRSATELAVSQDITMHVEWALKGLTP
jgi:DNA primase